MGAADKTAFKKGQRVRVLDWTGPFPDAIGTVESTDYADSFEVRFANYARTILYSGDELELAPAAPHTEEPPRATEEAKP